MGIYTLLGIRLQSLTLSFERYKIVIKGGVRVEFKTFHWLESLNKPEPSFKLSNGD